MLAVSLSTRRTLLLSSANFLDNHVPKGREVDALITADVERFAIFRDDIQQIGNGCRPVIDEKKTAMRLRINRDRNAFECPINEETITDR